MIKRVSILFLQTIIVLIGILVFLFMIRFPLTEGRAENLDTISIYFDPFILYGYASSIIFFVALCKAFKFLGYLKKDKLFTPSSIRTLRNIRYCAIILGVLIVLAGLYIMLFHNKEDDPAGFLGMCILLTFISVTASLVLAVFEKRLKNVLDLKNKEH